MAGSPTRRPAFVSCDPSQLHSAISNRYGTEIEYEKVRGRTVQSRAGLGVRQRETPAKVQVRAQIQVRIKNIAGRVRTPRERIGRELFSHLSVSATSVCEAHLALITEWAQLSNLGSHSTREAVSTSSPQRSFSATTMRPTIAWRGSRPLFSRWPARFTQSARRITQGHRVSAWRVRDCEDKEVEGRTG